MLRKTLLQRAKPGDIPPRSKFGHTGGNLFDLRGVGEGEGGYGLTFRNIVVEDPRPTHQAIKIMMQGVQPWGKPDKKRGPGDIYGITFQAKMKIKIRLIHSKSPLCHKALGCIIA